MRAARTGAACVVLLAAYLLPYFRFGEIWWRFAISTLVILGTGFLAVGPPVRSLFGIALSKRDLAVSLVVFALAFPVSYFVLTDVVVSESLGVRLSPATRWQINQFFQVLNDELLMRAALLSVTLRKFPYPRAVVVLLSLVFAVGHRVAYGLDGVEIGATALVTLFAFGVIANTLFVRFRHIGYGFALHYAWNFFRFNGNYYLDDRLLSEGATFNFIEGNLWVSGGAVVAMIVVTAICFRSAGSDDFGHDG